jgi:serine/threonine-protein phosphatase 2A regulatory subunit B''
MDYRGFLEFVLAMENKKSPESLQYFWRILDVYHKGAIDTFIINMFFRYASSLTQSHCPEARKQIAFRLQR